MQHALLQTVVEACMKKRHCKFTTSPGNGKDTAAVVVPASPSCPGQPPKFVEVAYKCRPLEFRSKIICENETIQLKCKRNARIAIYSATFGRVQFQSAQCLQPPGIEDESKFSNPHLWIIIPFQSAGECHLSSLVCYLVKYKNPGEK